MSVINADSPRAGAAGAGAAVAFTIDNSCRFNDGDSPTMTFTGGDAGTDARKILRFMYVKRGVLGTLQYLFSSDDGSGNDESYTRFETSNKLNFKFEAGSGARQANYITTTQVLRDVAGWYFLTIFVDTTPATPTMQIWNWDQEITDITKTTDTLNQNDEGGIGNASSRNHIGEQAHSGASNFDGYIAMEGCIIGQDFTDPVTSGLIEISTEGVPRPIDVSGLTFGSEGWLHDFAVAPGTGNGAGTDVSGNANHFTDSNLTAADQRTDTPTNNICTLNPLGSYSSITFSEGNTTYVAPAAFSAIITGTQAMLSGSWSFEVNVDTLGSHNGIGIVPAGHPVINSQANTTTNQTGHYYIPTGNRASPGNVWGSGDVAYGDSYTTGDLIRVEYDADAGDLEFFKNDASQGVISSVDTSLAWVPYAVSENATLTFIFDEDAWTDTPTSGFNELSTGNIAAPTVPDGTAHVQASLYTGDGADDNNVDQGGNSTFQPGLVAIKRRSAAAKEWAWMNEVRGATKFVGSDVTTTEGTSTDAFVSFDSDGFTVDDDATNGRVNTSSDTYIGYQWKGSEGSGSSNTDGTITTTVSANDTAGFSIVTYTSTNGGGAGTCGHGLSAPPDFIVVKNLGGTDNWVVQHSHNTDAPETDFLYLNTTAITADNSTFWNDTAPTASVFSVGTAGGTNDQGAALTHLALCWRAVEGFSAFGEYEGSGDADGPVLNFGFTPAVVLIKTTSGSTDHWWLWTKETQSYNAIDLNHRINADTDESNVSITDSVDILASGLKIRTTNATLNESGAKYIYCAWAEYPFGGVDATPAVAK